MISHFVIRKFAYLRSPRYSATVHSTMGGSESNGEEKSLRSLAARLWFMYQPVIVDNPSLRLIVQTWHGFDADEKPVTTSEFLTIGEFIDRMGSSRKGVR